MSNFLLAGFLASRRISRRRPPTAEDQAPQVDNREVSRAVAQGRGIASDKLVDQVRRDLKIKHKVTEQQLTIEMIDQFGKITTVELPSGKAFAWS